MRINGFEFEFPFARYAVIRCPFIFFTTCLFLFVNILGPFCWIRLSMSFINITEWKTVYFIFFITVVSVILISLFIRCSIVGSLLPSLLALLGTFILVSCWVGSKGKLSDVDIRLVASTMFKPIVNATSSESIFCRIVVTSSAEYFFGKNLFVIFVLFTLVYQPLVCNFPRFHFYRYTIKQSFINVTSPKLDFNLTYYYVIIASCASCKT